MFISEGKTWEDLLNKHLSDSIGKVWINNAGFSGHSTFGHNILLRDYIVHLKPSICLFLVGANDIDRKDLRPHDKNFTKTRNKWILFLARKSALANTLLNLYRNHLAKEKILAGGKPFTLLNKEPLYIPDSVIQEKISLQQPLVKAYASRLREMSRLCKSNGIEPIFVTQPCLPGETIDSSTGVDLATFPMSDKINGKLFWKYLQLYNAETITVAKQEGLMCIDLATELPKSSAYYYDLIHYNINGNAKVAEILNDKLRPYLQNKYPRFYLQHAH
jgi:lysophospholipase L1-like esterase